MEIDNNNNYHPQQVVEQERRQAADADADGNVNDHDCDGDNGNDGNELDGEDVDVAAVLLKLNSILDRREEFPFRTRNKIVILAKDYLEKLKEDIHGLISGTKDYDLDDDTDSYQGLDSRRDTEAEVETAIREFPDVVSLRDVNGDYPIQCLPYTVDSNRQYVCNWRGIPFIALLARLAIKFNQLEVEDHGGLLIEDGQGENTLQYLVKSSHSSYDDNEDHQQLVDNVYLTQMIQLRQMDLLKKEDIPEYNLFVELCSDSSSLGRRRIQFLVEWDPTLLLQPDEDGWLPLHWAARKCIQRFQVLFEYGIIYYPNKKGINLLFTKDEDTDIGESPFQYACEKHGRDEVMKVIEEILIRHNSMETPLNIVDALLTAAIDSNVHIDGVNFLLRRQPDVLFNLLHDVRDGKNVPVDISISGDGGGDGGHNDDDDDANVDEKNGKHQVNNNDDDDNDSNNDGDGDGKDDNDDGNDNGNHEEGTKRNNKKRKRAH